MEKHLRFDVAWAAWNNVKQDHPQKVMKDLGITYQHATPQSMGDQWWFWNCESIPDPLPPYLEVADLNPMQCIGYGLSKEEAEKIRDYKSQPSEQKPPEGATAERQEAIFEGIKTMMFSAYSLGKDDDGTFFNWFERNDMQKIIKSHCEEYATLQRNEAIQECIDDLKKAWTAPETEIETSVGIDRSIEILRKKLKR